MKTVAPSSAMRLAIAKPIPSVDAVTTATLSFKVGVRVAEDVDDAAAEGMTKARLLLTDLRPNRSILTAAGEEERAAAAS